MSSSNLVESVYEELEKINQEISKEMEMKRLLGLSTHELSMTVEDLERRAEIIEAQGSEWKTRYETQKEMNEYLARQNVYLTERCDNLKYYLKDNNASKLFAEMSESMVRRLIRQLSKEKKTLESDIKDYEARLEQEYKAYQKTNEERRMYLTELNSTKQAVIHKQQQVKLNQLEEDIKKLREKHTTQANYYELANSLGKDYSGKELVVFKGGLVPAKALSSTLPGYLQERVEEGTSGDMSERLRREILRKSRVNQVKIQETKPSNITTFSGDLLHDEVDSGKKELHPDRATLAKQDEF